MTVAVTMTFAVAVVSVANRREHWAVRARRVKREREAVALAWRAVGRPRFSLPVVVTLTRLGRGTLDEDNLAGAFKAMRDEVAHCLLDRGTCRRNGPPMRRNGRHGWQIAPCSCNDADPRIEWRLAQQRGTPGVEIEITAMEDPA